MGFFSRLGNLWKGFLSLWIADIEKDHPEIAYENAINSMIEKYAKLKSATAAIIRRRDDLDERYKKASADMAQTEAELNTAVETNQDDLRSEERRVGKECRSRRSADHDKENKRVLRAQQA